MASTEWRMLSFIPSIAVSKCQMRVALKVCFLQLINCFNEFNFCCFNNKHRSFFKKRYPPLLLQCLFGVTNAHGPSHQPPECGSSTHSLKTTKILADHLAIYLWRSTFGDLPLAIYLIGGSPKITKKDC